MHAGYHIATAVALEDTQADHAVFGCWDQPGNASAHTCWDGSLDGLLDSTFKPHPVYWVLR